MVVVTGDLTNEGIQREYRRCSALLSTIRTRKMIAVSGNHDYRNTGYLLFRKYFSSPSVSDLGEGVVLATIGTARPDRNEGEVGYRQNLWLENTLRRYKDRLTLVAMHHHLMDVPDTGSDHQTVRDAGDVLRTILASGVKLVLCGHNHRPWVWDFGKLKVVNAGTATSERPRGLFENTYNIITIRDGEAEVDLKIVGGRRMPLSDIVRDYSRSDSPEPAARNGKEAAGRRLLIQVPTAKSGDGPGVGRHTADCLLYPAYGSGWFSMAQYAAKHLLRWARWNHPTLQEEP